MQNISVIARIRPLLKDESLAVHSFDNKILVNCQKQQQHIRNGKKQSSPSTFNFDFDKVAAMNSTQNDIFQTVGKPIAKSCLSGYNGTVFAYGQTGSGKTFTILGLIPKIFHFLFEEIRKEQIANSNVAFEIKASFLEIYNQKLQDLLKKNNNNKLEIKEDVKNNRFYVENISIHQITNIEESTKLLKKCVAHRETRSTNFNANSSRSHFLMTIMIERKQTTSIPVKNINNNVLIKKRITYLNVVDLAGSERVKESGASGKTLIEARNINKSLSALNNVIMELSKQTKHIRYRDSKLTRLLKDSLGGNSLTFMIACVSPSNKHLKQTINTLQFAKRAKKIKSKIHKNVEKYCGNPKLLMSQVEILKNELSNINNQMNYEKENIKKLEEENVELKSKLKSNKKLEEENEQLRQELEKQKLEKENTRKLLEELRAKQNELINLQIQIEELKSVENKQNKCDIFAEVNQYNYDEYTTNIKENEYNYDTYNTIDTEEKNIDTLWDASNVGTISTQELMELCKKDTFKRLIQTEQNAIKKEKRERIMREVKNNFTNKPSDELIILMFGVESQWKKSKNELAEMVEKKKPKLLNIIKRNDPQGFVDLIFRNGMIKSLMDNELLMDLIDNFQLDSKNQLQYQKLMSIRKKKIDAFLTRLSDPQKIIYSTHTEEFDILIRNKQRSEKAREKKIKELKKTRRKEVLGYGKQSHTSYGYNVYG